MSPSTILTDSATNFKVLFGHPAEEGSGGGGKREERGGRSVGSQRPTPPRVAAAERTEGVPGMPVGF